MVQEDDKEEVTSWHCRGYPHNYVTYNSSANGSTRFTRSLGFVSEDPSTAMYLPDSAIPVERIVCVHTELGQDGQAEDMEEETDQHCVSGVSEPLFLKQNYYQCPSDAYQPVGDNTVSCPSDLYQSIGKQKGTPPFLSEPAGTKESLITYKVIPKATKQGRPMLVDSLGFSYIKSESPRGQAKKTYWRCTKHSRALMCRATIIQKGKIFTPGCFNHIHDANPGTCKAAEIKAEVRKRAQKELSKPAAKVVKEVMAEKLGNDSADHGNLPDASLLTRIVYRIQQSDLEVKHSDTSINFKLSADIIPANFLKADIFVNNARHILLFTSEQQSLLDKARILYMDRSTKMVMKPFSQIFSIHTYVKNNKDEYMQVPLAFCLMSQDRKVDYMKVLHAINERIPSSGKNTKVVVVDFMVNLWKAIRLVYRDEVTVRGSLSYWTQAIWERCQHFGLQEAFVKNKTTCWQIRQLMALPFLPADHIVLTFMELRAHALEQPSLMNLFQYIEDTWLFGYWKPEDCSGYICSIRTRSDVEYWHRYINHKVSRTSGVHLYRLLTLLFQRASSVKRQLKTVKESELCEYQKKQSRQMQAKVFGCWEKYNQGHASVLQLLEECGQLNGPTP